MKTLHRRLFAALAALVLIGFGSSTFAHYLWVTIDEGGDHGVANIYFEESPHPGDGFYLDPFIKAGKLWIRTTEQLEPDVVEMHEQNETEKKKRWLSAKLAADGPRSIESYGKFGVYAYGTTNVLLHYYAKCLEVDSHEDLHDLARAEQLDLDIVPHDRGKELKLKVIWKEAPAANRPLRILGPKKFLANLTTDEEGVVRFEIGEPGTYTFRTSVELDETGKEGDDDYTQIRHHATLKMNLPLNQ